VKSRQIIAGIDEAGRGPLAGPVVAAAVIFPRGRKILQTLNDSKLLTEQKREELFKIIVAEYDCGVGIVHENEIDELNILQATFKAMAIAVEQLQQVPDKCLIDGNRITSRIKLPQEAIIKGDQKIKEISAASIVAKVTRDRIMTQYHVKYPQYNFIKNKGYGTEEHIEAILKYGQSKVHRKSFTVCQKQSLF
jgi:ribonuclease HII